MSNSNTLDPLVELACGLPDVLNELKLTSDVSLSSVPKKKYAKCMLIELQIRNQVNKNRESLRKEYAKRLAADKAEEAARKKAEAKRAEEERIKKMSPAEQRKWEEKERLRQLKKQQKKRKV